MSSPNPTKNPFDWFVRLCLLILFGVVALTLAINLLARIWVWLCVIGLVGAAIWAAWWWKSRRPW